MNGIEMSAEVFLCECNITTCRETENYNAVTKKFGGRLHAITSSFL